jgi:hypothetical protein
VPSHDVRHSCDLLVPGYSTSDSEPDRGLDHDVKRLVSLMRQMLLKLDLTSDAENALAR